MKQNFKGWSAVAQKLLQHADEESEWFNEGQRASLRVIAQRIGRNGLVLADEVGMGKTRIAVALARAVVESGGRTAILIPAGLGFQWVGELKQGGVQDDCQVIRSLGAYLAAWDTDRTLPRMPWFQERLVLVSHAFPNWRLGSTSEAWRWGLLPTLYAEWRKRSKGRYPRGYFVRDELDNDWVQAAAKSICDNIPGDPSNEALRCIQALSGNTPWPGALEAGEYSRNEQLRPWLERAVGLGLGVFDLVIIDEAHKSRKVESGLSCLLNAIVLQAPHSRRLAMTATPVELDVSQWRETLGRIGVPNSTLAEISSHSEQYEAAVRRVRQAWRSSPEAREHYISAARLFQKSLHPYLLRRDKREDDSVRKFRRFSENGVDTYRQEKEIRVQVEALSPLWRRAVCAAESLSLVTRQAEDPVAKRLRLTVGSGHAIASLLDETQAATEDKGQQEYQRSPTLLIDGPRHSEENALSLSDEKRKGRALWWSRLMRRAAENGGLFEHPAIRSAVEAIESYTELQEKVLVFGRFTRPLRALTELLNAREMLRCLQENRSWPQSRVHAARELDEWPAVRAAHRQLNCSLDLREIDLRLERQYSELGYRRERLRERVFERIEAGLGESSQEMRVILAAAQSSTREDARTLLARALDQLLEGAFEPDDRACALAFNDLVTALRDRDEVDSDREADLGEEEAKELWSSLEVTLREEYGVQRGTFARLMYGETKLATRRTLQLAFNRSSSFPRVLVAQSMVGREGLNLHQACRVVVLLHPEWNPGVVEQQIGRVDRVGSRWASELDVAVAEGKLKDGLPRIEICPVIFQDTYDEHHWLVLNERWDDLRAQLHGIVVPERLRSDLTAAEAEIARQLDEAGPNFSPLRSDHLGHAQMIDDEP